MTASGLLSQVRTGAVVRGLVAFLVIAVVIPVVATIFVSFGPREWAAQYFHATEGMAPVLFTFAGMLVALAIAGAHVVNSFVATILGALISVALVLAVGGATDLDIGAFAFDYC